MSTILFFIIENYVGPSEGDRNGEGTLLVRSL